MSQPSIHDVARRAGVSIATVSFALNGRAGVSEDTRQRVEAAAEAIGYVRNPHGRGLKTGRSMTLAIQASAADPGITIPIASYFAMILEGAAREALNEGWAVIVAPHVPEQKLTALMADGGVVVDPIGTEPLIGVMQDREGPLVTIGALPEGSGLESTPNVDIDHGDAARSALDHLRGRGYRRPAALLPEARLGYAEQSARGYEEWCVQRDVEPVIGRFEAGSAASAESAARKLLELPEPADSALVYGDEALAAMFAIRQAGLAVPEEFGLVASFDEPEFRFTDPPITAIDASYGELGQLSVRVLLALIEGREPPASLRVEYALRVRGSTTRSR